MDIETFRDQKSVTINIKEHSIESVIELLEVNGHSNYKIIHEDGWSRYLVITDSGIKSKRKIEVNVYINRQKTSRLDAKKLIRNAVQNMNNTNSQKYELSPNTIEKKSLENEDFREIYDFHRMVKVSKSAERYSRNDERLNKKSRKKLRSPLTVGEKVLVLAERFKKKRHFR